MKLLDAVIACTLCVVSSFASAENEVDLTTSKDVPKVTVNVTQYYDANGKLIDDLKFYKYSSNGLITYSDVLPAGMEVSESFYIPPRMPPSAEALVVAKKVQAEIDKGNTRMLYFMSALRFYKKDRDLIGFSNKILKLNKINKINFTADKTFESLVSKVRVDCKNQLVQSTRFINNIKEPLLEDFIAAFEMARAYPEDQSAIAMREDAEEIVRKKIQWFTSSTNYRSAILCKDVTLANNGYITFDEAKQKYSFETE